MVYRLPYRRLVIGFCLAVVPGLVWLGIHKFRRHQSRKEAQALEMKLISNSSPEATNAYLRALDIRLMEQRGTDFTNPHFSPLRLGKKLEALDGVYDYDFERLAQTEHRLLGIDRRTVLQAIFDRVCQGALTRYGKTSQSAEIPPQGDQP